MLESHQLAIIRITKEYCFSSITTEAEATAAARMLSREDELQPGIKRYLYLFVWLQPEQATDLVR